MAFVLDNSVVCGWLLEKQRTPYSEAIAQRLQTSRAVAPALLLLEYTNVLRTACKKQNLIAAQAQHMLALLAQLPIATQDQALASAALVAGVGVVSA